MLLVIFQDASPVNIPVSRQAGGGSGRTAWENARPYVVTVKVTRSGKVWIDQKEVSVLMIRSLEKVVAAFKFIARKIEDIKVMINIR